MADKIQISQQRKQDIEAELHELRTVTRVEILERLQYAKSLGDLSENAEYHAARELQGKNEDRIHELESMLKNVEIIEKEASDRVVLASLVIVQKEGESAKREFTMVSPAESDMTTGKLSFESPIGSALMGKKKGDVVSVTTPTGTVHWKIISIR